MTEIDIFTEAKWEGYHVGHFFMSLLKRNLDEINQLLKSFVSQVLRVKDMAEIDIFTEAKWDGYHVGHFFMSLLKRNLDEINQIDAGTKEKETNASVLSRSVRLAKCLRRLGLKPGDVLALSGRNHLDVHIPHYAALLNGLPLVGVDPFFKYEEVYGLFKVAQPKIAFCEHENLDDFVRAANALNLDTKFITFGEGNCTLQKFMDCYDEDGSLEGFEPASFDLDKVYCWLIPTGGTTGTLKIAAFKHRLWLEKALNFMKMAMQYQKGQKTSWSKNLGLNISPVQWVSGFFNALGMTMANQCKLQTSADQTTEHIIDIINEYKPVGAFFAPSLMTSILNHEKKCDLTCLKAITLSGGAIYKDIFDRVKERVGPNTMVFIAYGQTESMGSALTPVAYGPPGHCGIPMPSIKVKLVDPETGKEITEPNTPGELWTNGPRFAEYYNNPLETAKAISEDGWYKTGDILYRDENNFYFFVERLSMLIKYRNYHVIPVELETLIRTHPDVNDVGVTSIPHPADVEHPVAFVVRRPGSNVTAADIKALVSDKLSDSKQLRGGVVFVDEIPLTSTGKVARMKLRKLVLDAKRE